MCQVFVQTPDTRTAVELLWHATSCRLFSEQLRAAISGIEPRNVDIDIGHRDPVELEQQLRKIFPKHDLPVWRMSSNRSYPDPEDVRVQALKDLQTTFGFPAS